MPRGLKRHYTAAIVKSAIPKRQTSTCQKLHHKTTMVREGLFSKRGYFKPSGAKWCQALKNKPGAEGGERGKKCEVKREMCPDLLSSFLRHAHFHQITPAPAEVSKSQTVSPLRVCVRQKGDALEPRHKPCSRSGALGWSGKIQARRIQTPLNVHQKNGCQGGPPRREKKGD